MEITDLIRQYPQLGDILSEFENRILFLENSLPSKEPESKVEIQPVYVDNDQLKARVIHLQNKLNEYIDKSKTVKNRDRI